MGWKSDLKGSMERESSGVRGVVFDDRTHEDLRKRYSFPASIDRARRKAGNPLTKTRIQDSLLSCSSSLFVAVES